MLQWKKAQGECLEKEKIRKSICNQLNVLSPNLSVGTNEMKGNLIMELEKRIFFFFFFSFLFIILISFYLFILDVEGYCSTWSHWMTHRHSVGLLWTRDEPDTLTSTWQHTTFAWDRHPCLRRYSKPQSQQASGRRPTPYTAEPQGSTKRFSWIKIRKCTAWAFTCNYVNSSGMLCGV